MKVVQTGDVSRDIRRIIDSINYGEVILAFSACGTEVADGGSGGGGGGSGTVTSVGLSMPAEFSVAGSPVTTAGTLAVTKATQAANLVYAGPASGGAAAPTFRALVAADVSGTFQPVDADLTAIAALAGTGIAVRTAADTWALRSLTAPAAGLTITNPAGIAGNPTFALANDLAALEALGATGLAARTAADTWAQRTLQAPAAGVTITNPAGIAGDPTLALANDLAALEGLAATGIAVRTGTDAWAQRSLAAPAAGFTITNPAGVAGDPTFVLANDLSALEALSGTGYARRTGVDTWTLDAAATAAAHNLLSATHGDTLAATVVRGDVIVGNATPAWSRLAVGAANRVLRSNGTDPSWAQVALATDVSGLLPIANGGTGQATALAAFNALSPLTTRGDLLTRNATDNARVAVGAAGRWLRSDGTDPSWQLIGNGDLPTLTSAQWFAHTSDPNGVSGGLVFGDFATLTNATLNTPTIGNFTNAMHNHEGFIGGGMLDHGLAMVAASLLDDDHTQYALRAGRTGATNDLTLTTSAAGTGILAGGTNAGAILRLRASSSGSAHTGTIRLADGALLWNDLVADPGSAASALRFDNTVTFSTGVQVLSVLNTSPTINVNSGTSAAVFQALNGSPVVNFNVTPAFGSSFQLFVAQPLLNFAAGVLAGPVTLVDQVDLRATGVASGTIVDVVGYAWGPRANAIGASPAAVTVTNLDGFKGQPRLLTNNATGVATVTTSRVVRVLNADLAGAGTKTLTTQIGVDVENLTSGATNISLRSQGAGVEMRHAGAGIFGANAARTNASVALEVQSTTQAFLLSRMTTAQRDTMTGVAIADGTVIYNLSIPAVQARVAGAWVNL